jgi:hypothetical protein
MLTSLRTVALLMLVAGASLGVLAGTLFAARDHATEPVVDAWVEERVKLYAERYGLDAPRADAIRHELQRHRHDVRTLIMDLRAKHAEAFRSLVERTESRITGIIGESTR